MSNPTNAKTENAWDKLGITTLPMSSVPDALDIMWGTNKKATICLIGETGIGKTPIIAAWAAERGAYVKWLNLGHMNKEDISMVMFNEDGTQYDNVPPKWLVEVNEQAAKCGCAVLGLDEWNRADDEIVNSMFTLPDERRLHGFELHPNVIIVAAMNPSDGSYMVNAAERDPAIRKRLNFIYVIADLDGWSKWARQVELDIDVIEFVEAQSMLFYDTAARDAGKAFACPANWEKVSELKKSAMKRKDGLRTYAFRALVTGQIGHVAATKFLDFLENRDTVIMPSEVIDTYLKGGRARVAKLLGSEIDKVTGKMVKDDRKGVRADVLANLNEGVALTLYSQRPEVSVIGANIAQYLEDLPPDFFMLFVTEYMQKYSAKSPEGSQYTRELSKELYKSESYKLRMAEVMHAHTKISESMGRG